MPRRGAWFVHKNVVSEASFFTLFCKIEEIKRVVVANY